MSEILSFNDLILISKTFNLWYKSSLKFPILISSFRSLLEEQINLTSTLISLFPFSLLNFWSVKTLKFLIEYLKEFLKLDQLIRFLDLLFLVHHMKLNHSLFLLQIILTHIYLHQVKHHLKLWMVYLIFLIFYVSF